LISVASIISSAI